MTTNILTSNGVRLPLVTGRLAKLLDSKAVMYGLLAALIVLYSIASAFAGTGGNNVFGQAENTIVGYLQGDLGVIISITFLGVGIAIGIARQSAFAIVMGIASALVLYYGPTVIKSIVVATIGVHGLS